MKHEDTIIDLAQYYYETAVPFYEKILVERNSTGEIIYWCYLHDDMEKLLNEKNDEEVMIELVKRRYDKYIEKKDRLQEIYIVDAISEFVHQFNNEDDILRAINKQRHIGGYNGPHKVGTPRI